MLGSSYNSLINFAFAHDSIASTALNNEAIVIYPNRLLVQHTNANNVWCKIVCPNELQQEPETAGARQKACFVVQF